MGITLAKAIEILEIETGSRHEPADPDLYDAERLAIEAMKMLRAIRHAHPQFKTFQLEGETEE